MLTKSILRQLANANSYSRGEAYFQDDSVRRITRTGNTFTANVRGSAAYTVSLSLDGATPDFACSCPYELGGICKHCVALGLAVLEQFGPDIERVGHTADATRNTIDLNTLWQQTTTEQKLTFLRQVLDKQPDLLAQLAQFVGSKPPVSGIVFFTVKDSETTTDEIDSIATTVYELLSELRFDENEIDEEDYYSEEGPDPTPLIETVLTDYAGQVMGALRESRLTDALTVCMGAYEGSQAATEPDADEYGVIGDYPEQVWEVWNELLADAYRQLARQVLRPDQIGLAMNQLADRVRFFDEADNPDELYFDLKPFEPLLVALVTDEPSARTMQTAIERHDWQKRGTEYVQLRLADARHDPDLWYQTADPYADRDPVIAQWLLQRRLAGDRPTLLRDLRRLTGRFPGTFDAFVLQHLDDTALAPGPDLNLYLTALENRCRTAGQLPDYLKLRTYWSATQRRTFADSLIPPSADYRMAHPLFYGQVLDTEGRAADLLAWLKTLSWPHVSTLPDLLTLTARTYPKECLELTRHRAVNRLETGKRDRTLYITIAGWLAALHAIPSLKSQTVVLATSLVATFSTLRALKDEFRVKGLLA